MEDILKKDLNIVISCIPLDAEEEAGKCVISGQPSKQRVIFTKKY